MCIIIFIIIMVYALNDKERNGRVKNQTLRLCFSVGIFVFAKAVYINR